MRYDELYRVCGTSVNPDTVRAMLAGLDDVPAAEVRRVYAAIGRVGRRTVPDMRRTIRSAILERMGSAMRVHA